MINLNRSANLIGGALLNREKTWQSYLPDAGDWKGTAFLLTVPLIVLSALLAYVVGLFAGDSFLFGQLRPTLGSTMLAIVSAAIGATIVAFIFGTLSGAFGGKRSFALGLAATSLAFVPGYFGQVVAQLPWIRGILGFALFIYALVCLWKIIPTYLEVPADRRTGHYVTSLLATIAVMVVFSMTIGRFLMPSVPQSRIAAISELAPTVAASQPSTARNDDSNSYIDQLKRKQELLMAAGADTYDPPENGRVTESQVQNFLAVMEQVHAVRTETEQRLLALSEKSDQDGDVSMGDMMNMMTEARSAADLNTLELQTVKDGGGNWAEHLWVRESLFTAARQPDTDDASRANQALYQKFEDRLGEFIIR